MESPYEQINGIRFIRDINKLVDRGHQIIVIDEINNRKTHDSIMECAKDLNIDRGTIKRYLLSGKKFKGCTFVFA